MKSVVSFRVAHGIVFSSVQIRQRGTSDSGYIFNGIKEGELKGLSRDGANTIANGINYAVHMKEEQKHEHVKRTEKKSELSDWAYHFDAMSRAQSAIEAPTRYSPNCYSATQTAVQQSAEHVPESRNNVETYPVDRESMLLQMQTKNLRVEEPQFAPVRNTDEGASTEASMSSEARYQSAESTNDFGRTVEQQTIVAEEIDKFLPHTPQTDIGEDILSESVSLHSDALGYQIAENVNTAGQSLEQLQQTIDAAKTGEFMQIKVSSDPNADITPDDLQIFKVRKAREEVHDNGHSATIAIGAVDYPEPHKLLLENLQSERQSPFFRFLASIKHAQD